MALHYVPTNYNCLPALCFTRTAGQVLTFHVWGRPDSTGGAHKGLFGSRNGSGAGDIVKLEKQGGWAIEYDPIGCGSAIGFAGDMNTGEWDGITGR